MKRNTFLLIVIILLASILRLYQLGKVPVSLEWDEVALGYDAFSILKTGKDQFGQLLPNNFRSLDDYKPPLYVYMAVPYIFLFGLTEFATRAPAAVFGILGVLLTYYLVLEIFKNIESNKRYLIALLSSLFLAISPWHLQFSRAAFETNLSVTVTIIAVLLFLKGLSSKPKLFLLSSFFFGLALFSYHSTRVVTPILLIALFLLFLKKLPQKKFIILFFTIYAIFLYFFIPIATNPWAQIRFLVTNDLNIAKYTKESADAILNEENTQVELVSRIFHNRRLVILNYENVKRMLNNYLLHFSPKFLFVEGDAPLHHAPGFGMMYFFDLPLLLLGVTAYLIFLRNRENYILFLWLIVGPIPASVTWQAPHSVRSEIVLPTLQIISAIGFTYLILFIKKELSILRYFTYVVSVFIVVFGLAWYMHQYYFHTNRELSRNWMYGRREAVEITENLKNKYSRVLVSLNVDMPHIFWLFYTKYSPSLYLDNGGTVSGGFADERNKFDKYEFRNFSYNSLSNEEKYLLVGIPKDFPPDARVITKILYLDGSEAIIIAENKQR